MSECSNHCGPGTRMVSSRCVQMLTTLGINRPPHPLPPHACTHIERPKEFEPCDGPCDETHWSYTEWGACTASCGGGTQMRTASCVDSNDRKVPEHKCNVSDKLLKKSCGHEVCPQWTLGEWSPVSILEQKKKLIKKSFARH